MDSLEQLATLPPALALVAAVPLMHRIAAEPGLLAHLSPSARAHPTPLGEEAQQPTIASLQVGGVADPTLQLFRWPPGVWTPIHDHTSWGIYLCLAGVLLEDRFTRLDDASQPARAHLRHAWRATWRPRQHSTLLPYAAGIHRVGNPTDRPAISLHLYGPPTSAIDGRDYDASRDFVCDRLPERLPLTLGEGWGEGAASQVRAA